MNIELKLLGQNVKVPNYATIGSAALDLCAQNEAIIYPEESEVFNTGIAININDIHVVGIVEGRSGLRFRYDVSPLGGGVIDSDYQGEILVHVYNHGNSPYHVSIGDRIAQIMFMPVIRPNIIVVEEFSNSTDRGEDGFGSTGV